VSDTFEQYARRVMSGQATGPGAALLRAALSAAAVPYSLAVSLRNRSFDAGARKPARLPRPVISIGNITTGGTGKTPVVRWLAERLRSSGRPVAVLSRGYKAAAPGELGDEQRMLVNLLNRPGEPPVNVRADPNRFLAGEFVLREHPEVAAFVLDDGFQHRRLARDFDLVLIDATEPFGFGRVLPRGMLREPLSGLRRADAFLLTRSDLAEAAGRARIADTLTRYNPASPVYESVHAPVGFRTSDSAELLSLDALRDRRWFAFCGIGSPETFVRQLTALGGTSAGHRAFADHHDYTAQHLADLASRAGAGGADVLVTTEKDWAKLAALAKPARVPPIWRLDVRIRFNGDDEAKLFGDIERAMARRRN
jgi:tetraacyldisaccharide 4'-kinase